MMSKDFKTYLQQMRYLRNDKNISCKGTEDKILLCRTGYFNLINGYKLPFVTNIINNNHVYINGTNIKEIYMVKKFDDELRIHLLKYITTVEEEVRNLVAYKFDEINNKGKIPWYRVEAFNPAAETQKIINVIANSYIQIEKSKQNYVRHYIEEHKQIPTWILLKTISFSSLINFIKYSKKEIKNSICELYNIKDANGNYDNQLLHGSLQWMRMIRNSCAHNERVFGMKRNGRIKSIYFNSLSNTYKRKNKQNLFDLIVYMRYFLPNNDFDNFTCLIKTNLERLNQSINNTAFQQVRAAMGIHNLDHLDILMARKKEIYYHRF